VVTFVSHTEEYTKLFYLVIMLISIIAGKLMWID